MHGFGGNNDTKIEQITQTIEEMKIDMMLFNETNFKSSTRKVDRT